MKHKRLGTLRDLTRKAAAIYRFIGTDDPRQKVLQSHPFTFRERAHDPIPHREDDGMQSGVEFKPRWREAEDACVAARCSLRLGNQPSQFKVPDHPLNTGEINADPRGQSALINSWRIVKRS